MYAEDFRSHNGSDRKCVEDVDEGLPDLNIDPTFAFIIETVNFGQGRQIHVDYD